MADAGRRLAVADGLAGRARGRLMFCRALLPPRPAKRCLVANPENP
jgi:hypothetical protein